MDRVALSFGSNLGNRFEQIQSALEHLQSTNLLTELVHSSWYETAPWGAARGGKFLNKVVTACTSSSPLDLLDALQQCEVQSGRVRTAFQYEARTLDIDVLLWSEQIILNDRLQIPHPRLHLRRFVLVPLVEIAPDWMIPGVNKTSKQLLSICPDQSEVSKIECNQEGEAV